MPANALRIIYTETARTAVNDIAHFYKNKQVDAKELIKDAIEEFEKKVGTFPLGCPVSPQLLSIGCDKYRECNTAGGFRILYAITDTVVVVHIIVHQRQDLQQLLFKRIIQA